MAGEIVTSNGRAYPTDAQLYIAKLYGSDHFFLKLPSALPEDEDEEDYSSMRNIIIVDVSTTMRDYSNKLCKFWNAHVVPKMRGSTVLYACSESKIVEMRNTPVIEKSDFTMATDEQKCTNWKMIVKTIMKEYTHCDENNINVYIITASKSSGPNKLRKKTLLRKSCNVYILGIGNNFSMDECVLLRFKMCTNRNIPALFWVRSKREMKNQICNLASFVSSSFDNHKYIKFLDVIGQELPLTPRECIKNLFNVNEWIYFPPNSLLTNSKIRLLCGDLVNIPIYPLDIKVLDAIVCQWNITLIERATSLNHSRVDRVLNFMEELHFSCPRDNIKAQNRMIRRQRYILDILSNRISEENRREWLSRGSGTWKYLCEAIHVTTTPSIFVSDEEYIKTKCVEFKHAYDSCYEDLSKIKECDDDRCAVYHISTLTSLLDPNLIPCLERAYHVHQVMKIFTMSGIPVNAHWGPMTTRRPWLYDISSILEAPYQTLSIDAIIHCNNYIETYNRRVIIDETRGSICNCIIPVFPAAIAEKFRAIVNTTFYLLCCGYAITGALNIINSNFHLAALGAAWVYFITRYPLHSNRPDHIEKRIRDIIATAKLYTQDGGQIQKYLDVLGDKKNFILALMPADAKHNLKCDSLIKPMFYYQFSKKCITPMQFVGQLLLEFVRRCLTGENYSSTDYSNLFEYNYILNEQGKRRWLVENEVVAWVANYVVNNEIHDEQFSLQDFHNMSLLLNIKLSFLSEKGRAALSGINNVTLEALKAYASYMGVKEKIMNDNNILVVCIHVLEHFRMKDKQHPLRYGDSSLYNNKEYYQQCMLIAQYRILRIKLREFYVKIKSNMRSFL